MPTYGYLCTNEECLEEKDVFHGMSKRPRPKCSVCGSRMKKKGFAPGETVHFILKGPLSDYPSKVNKWNREQTQKNKEAEVRMRKNRDPIGQQYAVVDADAYDAWVKDRGGVGIDQESLVDATKGAEELMKGHDETGKKSPKVKNVSYGENEHGPLGHVKTAAGKSGVRKKLKKKKKQKLIV